MRIGNTIEYPFSIFSWEILSATIYIKTIDLSALIHHGTGIPSEICHYFGVSRTDSKAHRNITLIVGKLEFDAYITPSHDNRVRLFWKTDFSDFLNMMLPSWKEYFSQEQSGPIAIMPKIKFEKDGKYSDRYIVSIIDLNEIVHDMVREEEEVISRPEGSAHPCYGTRYERDPRNRVLAIEYHGYSCAVCGYNFQEHFGFLGKGYIEIHHIKPLSTLGGEQLINPITDLIPLCSNCHRIIHRRRDSIYTIQELIEITKK
jgi:5-methylcytosine-specific restriction protein A